MKFKKVLFSLILCVMALGLFTTGVFARSCGQDLADEVAELKKEVNEACSHSPGGSRCMALVQDLTDAENYAKEHCVCGYYGPQNSEKWSETGFHYYNTSLGSWAPIGRFEGDKFCIDAGTLFSVCGTYGGASAVGTNFNTDALRYVYAYNKAVADGYDQNSMYAAAQTLIWEALGQGREHDVPDSYRNTIKNYAYPSSSEKYVIDFDKDTIKLNLNDTYSVNDRNGQVSDSNFGMSQSSGITVNLSGNTVSGKSTNIYPLTKTVTYSPKQSLIIEGGGVASGNIYWGTNTQSFIAYADGVVDSMKYKYYYGDSFTVNTPTGAAQIIKLDDFGRPVLKGQKFKVWYAKEDVNGEFEYEGKKYSKYKEFNTEADWKNGVNQSTFVSNGAQMLRLAICQI